jgi:hypothetical protein
VVSAGQKNNDGRIVLVSMEQLDAIVTQIMAVSRCADKQNCNSGGFPLAEGVLGKRRGSSDIVC